jgi:hypothetical protein
MPKHIDEIKNNRNKFFQETKQECKGISQTTTVTVNIDQKEGCFDRFMNALSSCLKPKK